MTDKKTFGSFIKSKRTEKNYSQKALAELLCVTEGAVSKWERGASYPDITLIADICRVLDISEHEFITATNDTTTRKLQHEARQFRVISGAWFWIPTISYAVALITCFICNLAVNHTLSWFFVVLSSLVCAYSFMPTFTYFFNSKKLLVFTVTSLLSICLLLFTCAVYTKSIYWVPTACIGTLIGYVLLFLPIILSKSKIANFKFLISFTLAFVLTVLLLLVIYVWHPFMLASAIKMTCYGFAPVILCAVICCFNFDAFLKTGVCTLIGSVAFYFSGYVVNALFNGKENYYQINLNNWSEYTNGNIMFVILVSFLFISAAFTGIGICRIIKKR